MYTTYPLATIDTINNHTGFWIMVVIAVVIMFFMAISESKPWVVAVFGSIVIGISGAVSWTTGKIVVYPNIPVTARLVSTWGEQHQENVRRGKQTVQITVHNQYVSYQLDDGSFVSYPMGVGIAYPPVAQLYKN
jgi:hypothetical protein